MKKTTDLMSALSLIRHGDMVALGGNVLHRSPVGAVKALARLGLTNLHLVKTAIAMEADLLCGTGTASTLSAGFVGYETQYGLCGFYRHAVESGRVKADEHACYSVITGLRAAAYGVPFLPVRGFNGSDLVDAVGLKEVSDPYSGEKLIAIRAMRPRAGILHVQRADAFGNCEIIGPQYEDQIIGRAAEFLIVTCEELVPEDYFGPHRKADLSGALVSHVVQMPLGAAPGSCPGFYDIDHRQLQRFKALKTEQELRTWLEENR